MRVLMIVEVPAEGAKEALRSGKGFQALQDVLSRVNPEAVYFAPKNGKRTAFIIFDLDDPGRLPAIQEPLFLSLNATIEVLPCFTPPELEKAMPDIEAAAHQYL